MRWRRPPPCEAGRWPRVGAGAESITQIHQGLAASQAIGAARDRPYHLALLAEVSAQVGQTTEGWRRWPRHSQYYPRAGCAGGKRSCIGSRANSCGSTPVAQPKEVEACFQHALAVARRQEAKSLELRAAMSLVRLWQQQGKRAAASRAARADLWVVHRGV